MDFFRGGHVKIRGKRQKFTIGVSLPSEDCAEAKIMMNKVMRKNLKVVVSTFSFLGIQMFQKN